MLSNFSRYLLSFCYIAVSTRGRFDRLIPASSPLKHRSRYLFRVQHLNHEVRDAKMKPYQLLIATVALVLLVGIMTCCRQLWSRRRKHSDLEAARELHTSILKEVAPCAQASEYESPLAKLGISLEGSSLIGRIRKLSRKYKRNPCERAGPAHEQPDTTRYDNSVVEDGMDGELLQRPQLARLGVRSDAIQELQRVRSWGSSDAQIEHSLTPRLSSRPGASNKRERARRRVYSNLQVGRPSSTLGEERPASLRRTSPPPSLPAVRRHSTLRVPTREHFVDAERYGNEHQK